MQDFDLKQEYFNVVTLELLLVKNLINWHLGDSLGDPTGATLIFFFSVWFLNKDHG